MKSYVPLKKKKNTEGMYIYWITLLMHTTELSDY